MATSGYSSVPPAGLSEVEDSIARPVSAASFKRHLGEFQEISRPVSAEQCGEDAEHEREDEEEEAMTPRRHKHPVATSSLASTRSPSQCSSTSRVRTPAGLTSGAASPAGSSRGSICLPPVAPGAPSRVLRSSAGLPAKVAPASRFRLTLTVTARFAGAEVSVELQDTQAQQVSALPSPLPFEVPATAEFRSSGPFSGTLNVKGAPPIPFGIQNGSVKPNGDRGNFVSNENRQRIVVCHAEDLERGTGTSVKGEGTVVEVSVSEGYYAEMTLIIRRAKKKELTRLAQKEHLLRAMEKRNYSSLLAQITKSKSRKVELALIDQAERILKSIVMADGTFLNHRELSKLMKWKRVTQSVDDDVVQECPCSAECMCNAGQAQDGEVLTITEGAVQDILQGIAPAGADGDKWLFKALVKAAYSVPEGCVWKSGGKFLLTNEERNQSVTAIVNLLERDNAESDAGKGIRALVAYTEKEYNFRVTAVQLNFHPNEKSSHKQHRDIYGAGQKGGINCTCSFMKCQGTVCYSLGSNRQILCETITDNRSKYAACGEECEGRKVLHCLRSGSAMFFNDKWNTSHTHGIPSMSEPCGPRISIALLCA